MTKIVIIDTNEGIRSYVIGPTGAQYRKLADEVMEKALNQGSLRFDEISYVIATGYGRLNVPFADRQITELSCQAKGVSSFFPNARTAIDIGGQDAKVMKINQGRLAEFVMNDKCAAGTGRYLEILADTLGLKIGDLGKISLRSGSPVKISSTCTIFAQQEIMSHIASGRPFEDIAAGLHEAIASRAVGMAKGLQIEPDVVFTGGVAKNIGVIHAIRENLGCVLYVPDEPLLTGAMGAALLGKEITRRAFEKGEIVQRKGRHLQEVILFR